MHWGTFFSAFGAILLAELADKTQLAAISISAESKKPLVVLAGSVSAYIIVTAISVFLGAWVAKYLRPEYIRYGGASIFIIIGVLILFGKI